MCPCPHSQAQGRNRTERLSGITPPLDFTPCDELRRLLKLDKVLDAQFPLARPQRNAVHHPAPDLGAMDEADAPRTAGREHIESGKLGPALKMLARFRGSSTSWYTPGRCWRP